MTTSELDTTTAPHQHAVRFYDDDDSLVCEVAAFLDEALGAGGTALVVATPAHRAAVARRVGAGKVTMLDAEETLARFMIGDKPDARLFEMSVGALLAAAPAGRRLHAFGEMVALLCHRGNYAGAVELERIWNDAAKRHTFSLFCAYPWQLFSSASDALAFQQVCLAHSHIANSTQSVGKARDEELATLQQKARALATEVARRSEAEESLRQRERELSEFLEHASEGIHKVAADGTILYANRAELEMFGYRWEEYVGQNIADFYVERTQIESILARLAAGEVLRDEAALIRCKDGRTLPIVVCSNANFENGRLTFTRCFSRDASERVARDEALRRSEELLAELREASRVKDDFLAMLGHELRNPLSPIVTALQLMRLRGEESTTREQDIIQRQVEHMVRLVDDLLDISKIKRGKIELKRERCEAKVLVAKAVEQASFLFEQMHHRLELRMQPGIECVCDPVRIAQVIANLLTNAARYTPAGGEVILECRSDGADRLTVSVRDNGNGIDSTMLGRIFEPFYQGARNIDRAEGGLGVGLAIVRSLVELHGGSVEAQSEGKGRGSEFIVHLPLALDSEDVRPAHPQAAASAHAARRRVLVVDDNADAALTMSELLRLHGHEVAVYHDAPSALSAAAGFAPDVALLDIGLPVMDGYELGTRLRKLCGERCHLVAVTGYGQEADRQRAADAGFDSHLVKPVEFDELVAVISG